MEDKQTGGDVVLSEQQVALVKRLQKGQFGDVRFNEFEVSLSLNIVRVRQRQILSLCSDF